MPSRLVRALMRIARAVLQQVINQITSQIERVQDELISEMNKLASEVESGTIWKGNGANNFVSCVNEECVPFCNDIVESVGQVNNDITTAINIIEQADTNASAVVKSLRDQFESI